MRFCSIKDICDSEHNFGLTKPGKTKRKMINVYEKNARNIIKQHR